ncbi:hypothetical protein MZK49_06635 [Ensifer sesbaniae]|jgi:hypothetical protein|uniref:hypothetical protein n=1 Tax=Ensifer sesbaniae TaxID=1214071 RepID=UPI001568DACA|nr:hypothetical protein [Ensifer sesbaniae]MCK3776404.1 hypothetical protein [Ensifer sesbaniae]NRQ15535.1 hypothetical protein [Ensifer sesbaniae]
MSNTSEIAQDASGLGLKATRCEWIGLAKAGDGDTGGDLALVDKATPSGNVG